VIKKVVIGIICILFTALIFVGCNSSATEQTSQTGNSATPFQVISAGNEVILKGDIVVGKAIKAELKGIFLVTTKVISGNGRELSANDFTPGAAVTKDPQIVVTVKNVNSSESVTLYTKAQSFSEYYLEVISLDSSGKLLKSNSLPSSALGSNQALTLKPSEEHAFVVLLPKETMKFEVKGGLNPVPNIPNQYSESPEVNKRVTVNYGLVAVYGELKVNGAVTNVSDQQLGWLSSAQGDSSKHFDWFLDIKFKDASGQNLTPKTQYYNSEGKGFYRGIVAGYRRLEPGKAWTFEVPVPEGTVSYEIYLGIKTGG
jgi:hypothetical protein